MVSAIYNTWLLKTSFPALIIQDAANNLALSVGHIWQFSTTYRRVVNMLSFIGFSKPPLRRCSTRKMRGHPEADVDYTESILSLCNRFYGQKHIAHT